jgi:nitroimidazol reductase NimA-like FMN-containing flavoprotein (pyridoxamine 5'-phosphate oxidase superfamily)
MGEVRTEQHRAFLEANHTAVMATVDDLGRSHAVPVLCALIGGELWSSGTDLRVRTRHLAARPYATLTVLNRGGTGSPPAATPTTWTSTGPPWSPSGAWSTRSPRAGLPVVALRRSAHG